MSQYAHCPNGKSERHKNTKIAFRSTETPQQSFIENLPRGNHWKVKKCFMGELAWNSPNIPHGFPTKLSHLGSASCAPSLLPIQFEGLEVAVSHSRIARLAFG